MSKPAQSSPGFRLALGAVTVVLLIAVLSATLTSCRRTRTYSQNSADGVVRSLAEMIKDGNVRLIPSLIHSDDPKMRELLAQLGPLFDRMYRLSQTLQEKYPDEFQALLEKAAAKGSEKIPSTGRSSQGRSEWEDRFTLLIADPFGMLDQQMDRVSVVYVDDETFALTIDDKPAFGVGVLIREGKDGKWYFHLPQNIPGLNSRLPQSDAEWRIMNAMLKSVTNGVEWTERRISEEKNAGQLEEIWGQLAIDVGPALVVQWGLYEQATKARDARLQREKAEAAAPPEPREGR